jgi:hypothetical protein
MTVVGQQMKDEMLALQNELASYKKIASDLDADKRRMADQLERNANAVSVFLMLAVVCAKLSLRRARRRKSTSGPSKTMTSCRNG